jgi:hypothetical protein
MDRIESIYHLPKATAEKTRTSFHEHKLIGERWWWSGCYLGHGFILLCSEERRKKVLSFSDCPDRVACADESADEANPLSWMLLFCISYTTAGAP